MRLILLAALSLLLGDAPTAVRPGTFQTWLSSKAQTIDFSADGVTVHVEPLPCPHNRELAGESCSFDGFNNQAAVTIGGSHQVPKTVLTDPQASYARIAIVRFDRRDARSGVIVESQYGGSGGILTVQLLVPWDNGYRVLALDDYRGAPLEGKLADAPADLSGDGRIDLVYSDGAFDSRFGCNGCTPRPPILFAVKNGTLVDESRDPALRPVFVADMTRRAATCLSRQSERNGACAAYVADAARAGRFAAAWTAMLGHYQRADGSVRHCRGAFVPRPKPCPGGERPFPEALREFLVATGYLPPRR